MKDSEPAHDFGRNAISTFVTRVLSALLALASSIILARVLGPQGNGVFAMTLLLPSIMLRFVSVGTQPATIYYVAQRRHPLADILAGNLVFSVTYAAIGVLAGTIIVHFFRDALFQGVARSHLFIALAIIPGSLLAANLGAMLIGLQRFKESNFINLAQAFSLVVFVALAAWAGNGGIRGALLAVVASWTVADALLLVRTRKFAGPISFSKGSDYLTKASSYGLLAQSGSIIGFINYRIDLFLVNAFLGPAQVGVYAVGFGIAEMLWLISGTASTVLYPAVSQDLTGRSSRQLTPQVARITFELTLVAALALFFLGDRVISLLYSPTYLPAVTPLCLLLPGVVMMSVSHVLTADISGRGKVMWNTCVVSIAAVVNVVLNILWIPRYGTAGAAMASSVSYSLSSLVRAAIFCRLSGTMFTNLLPQRSDWDVLCRGGRALAKVFVPSKPNRLQKEIAP